MFDKIFGHDIAPYIRGHRALIVVAVVLGALSALFVVVPAYLLQPLVDEGMKTSSEPVGWSIPWLQLSFPFSIK